MPHRRCSACDHPDHEAIDLAIKSSAPLRAVAKQFGLSLGTVFQHSHHDDHKQRRTNTGETARIEKEIARLHGAQNRAQRKKNTLEALAIARELRAWHGLRLKAAAIDAAKPSQQSDQAITPQEALSLSQSVIESMLADPAVQEWLRSLSERLGATQG